MATPSDENSNLRQQHELPRIYLLLENPSKSNNLGSIIRCANAFGILTIVAIGYAQCSVYGSHGASKNVQIIDFPVGDQAVAFLRNDCRCNSIVGLLGPLPGGYNASGRSVLLMENESSSSSPTGTTAFGSSSADDDSSSSRRSFPVDAFHFSEGNICFAVCKLRQGLPLSLAHLCDSFVHIPHMTVHTERPLLDTPACLSILLHEYTGWAGYNERGFQGHKFDVVRPRHDESDEEEKKRMARASRSAMSTKDEEMDAGTLGDLFDSEHDNVGDY